MAKTAGRDRSLVVCTVDRHPLHKEKQSPGATQIRRCVPRHSENLSLAEKRSFSTAANPDVRWWWGGVPDELRLAALKTNDLSNIRPDDYVGTQKCSKCHEKKS